MRCRLSRTLSRGLLVLRNCDCISNYIPYFKHHTRLHSHQETQANMANTEQDSHMNRECIRPTEKTSPFLPALHPSSPVCPT
jgi:hypothetical protein